VLRGGYGIFYEQLGASQGDVNQQGFSQRTNLVASLDNGLTYRATMANPFPDGFLQPAGASSGLLTFVGRSPGFFDPSRRTGYMQRWSFGVQRELPWRVLLETSYLGNRGTKLAVGRDLTVLPEQYYSRWPVRDQATIDFLTANVLSPFFGIAAFEGSGTSGRNVQRQRLLTPYPHFGNINTDDDTGYSWYHSLQVRVEKRMSRGFTIMASYTFSKFMEAVEVLNSFDARPTEVISPQDRPHHLAITGIYELPVGKGRRYLASAPAWMDHLLGGWQFQGIYQGQSGPPIGFGNILFYGANVNDIVLPTSRRSVERWFNIDAGFERDNSKQLAWNVRTWPLRLSGLRADGFNQFDLSLFKNFRLTERVRLQLRAEAQDALNHAMFAAPNTGVNNTLFGQVSATQFAEQRRITVAGKLTF
jgi:hypothetical protein